MMWIDVETASGVRQGDGPITTASAWQSVRRLDAAGTFSFTMPASDPRSNLLAHKLVVRCWLADDAGIREVGAGIIDQIEVQPSTDTTPAMLRVSGDDLLRELANRTVGDLALHEPIDYSTTHATEPLVIRYQTYTSGNNLTLPASVDLQPYVDDNNRESFIYFQHNRPFSSITITLTGTNNTLTDTFQVQYYNNQEEGKPTWEAVGGLVNGAAAVGPDPYNGAVYPFGVAGETVISFDPPNGWSPLGDQYVIRMFDQVADLTSFTISACYVTIEEPVSDGLQRIMALAPTAWSLDTAGRFATTEPVYMDFGGESVLTALVMLAEQTGEHFCISPAGRRVWWLGAAQASSGLRAVQGNATTDSTMLITQLARTSDSYELCTRLYAFGGGIGDERLTMEKATRNRTGYTLGPNGAYLERDSAVATYGRIDYREEFPDIAPVDVSDAQVTHAANALYDRVYNVLRRRSQLQYAYRLAVAPNRYDVWPGQTVQVVYHEWVEGYHAVNIDATLWVLETQQQITPAGVHVVGLTVATVDYWWGNDYRAVAKLMGSVSTARRTKLPANQYSDSRAGVPAVLNIRNGQVTSVRRVQAIEDRWHTVANVVKFRTTNGIITAVEAGSSSGGSSGGGSIFPPRPIPPFP